VDAPAPFARQAFIPASLAGLTRRDAVWLVPCTLCLWLVGVILALDDSGRFFRGNEPSAPTWAACGIVLGVFGIWRWRQWLIHDQLLRPAHDSADDLLWLLGASGALLLYIFITPPGRLLPPNATLCILSGLAGARLLYSGLTRRIGNTLHCSRCNYHIVDTSLPRRCPECAGVWAHRLVRGKITRSTRLIYAGVLLLFIFTLAPVPRFEISRSFIRRQMATSWIVSQAATSLQDGLVYDADLWRELGKRTLTDQQAKSLASPILDQSATNNLRDYAALTWLENLVFDGKAPRSVADAFMDQSLAFQLTGPPHTFVGRGAPLRIQALELRRMPRDRIALYLEYVIDSEDPNPLFSPTKWELLSTAMSGRAQPAFQQASSGSPNLPVPAAARTASTPLSDVLGNVVSPIEYFAGIRTYRARIWAAIVVPGTAPSLSPSTLAPLFADPTAKPPVHWLKSFDLQTSFMVYDVPRSPPRPASPAPLPNSKP
jgi:hypothetical protein